MGKAQAGRSLTCPPCSFSCSAFDLQHNSSTADAAAFIADLLRTDEHKQLLNYPL